MSSHDRSARLPVPPLLRRGLKIVHFRLFASLAQTGQMSAAADALAISQPAASRLAAEIERITGAELYQRTSHGIVLTGAGRAFARRAKRMLLEIEETERELDEILAGESGVVNIGAVTGAAVEHVLPSVRQARLDLPRVTLNIEVGTSDVLGDALVEGSLDFILARLPKQYDPRLFEARFVGPEPISLIVRRGHPLLRKPEAAMERLAEFDWVMPLEGTLLRTTIEAALVAKGMPLPAKVLNTSSFLLTIVMVAQTNAIAPVATSVARFFRSKSVSEDAIEELSVDLALEVEPYALITVKDRAPTPAARAIYELVASAL